MPLSSVDDRTNLIDDEADAQTIALRVIAGVLVVGTLYLLGGLMVPFVLALVLAIALSPASTRMTDRGVPRVLANLLCTLFIVAVLATAAGLILYQAGTILQDSDKYLARFSQGLAGLSERVGGEHLMRSLGVIESETPVDGAGRGPADGPSAADRPSSVARSHDGSERSPANASRFWDDFVRRNVRALLRWVGTGLGGLLGFLGGLVVFLAFLFYMLQTRDDWVERLSLALARLGMQPRRGQMVRVQHEIVTFLGCLSLVSLGYVALVTLCLWLIGVPQPLLWGVIAGLLEFIPYFGPLIAMILPAIVSLSLGTWWQPALVVGQYVGLHMLESYVVTPLLYGRAVHVDPVLVLFGVLFFGWLWGPLGLAVALPTLLLLRGLLMMSPDTPALDALTDADEHEKAAVDSGASG